MVLISVPHTQTHCSASLADAPPTTTDADVDGLGLPPLAMPLADDMPPSADADGLGLGAPLALPSVVPPSADTPPAPADGSPTLADAPLPAPAEGPAEGLQSPGLPLYATYPCLVKKRSA